MYEQSVNTWIHRSLGALVLTVLAPQVAYGFRLCGWIFVQIDTKFHSNIFKWITRHWQSFVDYF